MVRPLPWLHSPPETALRPVPSPGLRHCERVDGHRQQGLAQGSGRGKDEVDTADLQRRLRTSGQDLQLQRHTLLCAHRSEGRDCGDQLPRRTSGPTDGKALRQQAGDLPPDGSTEGTDRQRGHPAHVFWRLAAQRHAEVCAERRQTGHHPAAR